MSTTVQLEFESLHRLACDLRVPVSRIIRVIDQLRLEPAMRIDSTNYYSPDQADKIARHVKASESETPRRAARRR